MRTGVIKFPVLILLIFSCPFLSFSQKVNPPIPSNVLQEDLDRLYGADQNLVSGKIYHPAAYGSVSGHPFCLSDEWEEGQLTMNGRLYDNLLLKYDIVSNELVLNTLNLNNSSLQISLETGAISSFMMDKRKFVVFPGSQNKEKPVFCELVSSGTVDFLLLRSKEMRLNSSGATDFEYKEYYKNYLYKDGELINFKGRRSLFRLFPEQRKELRKYITKQELLLGNKNTNDRALLVDYCNRIISEQE